MKTVKALNCILVTQMHPYIIAFDACREVHQLLCSRLQLTLAFTFSTCLRDQEIFLKLFLFLKQTVQRRAAEYAQCMSLRSIFLELRTDSQYALQRTVKYFTGNVLVSKTNSLHIFANHYVDVKYNVYVSEASPFLLYNTTAPSHGFGQHYTSNN